MDYSRFVNNNHPYLLPNYRMCNINAGPALPFQSAALSSRVGHSPNPLYPLHLREKVQYLFAIGIHFLSKAARVGELESFFNRYCCVIHIFRFYYAYP